ncbi:lytic polysaccharide monooxygenase [Streptomyces sp. CB02400]|uniref:lytic polysaccharide monooxygenase n=1 Tax=Streptomyces sp. CB02400 TaxID=1703944 RepID=UPI00093A58B6|nr:lytic polysaccharide monooxygenase [Streptomyces sp. CB02400]OKJ93400.1 chitinase [Streptomyces sp. CB02400]
MSMKRKVAVAVGALVAPVVAISLPAPTASAHGWVVSPGSRQDQCANRVVQCGQIKWEPASVEGPKGLRDCSGGDPRWADLDDDSKGWRVTPIGTTHTFTWTIEARHATSNWQYFIGDQKVAQFDGRGAQPPASVSHQLDFGGFTGRQKVLAVWNIADTANAFYACIDVNIGGGDDGGGDDEPGDCIAPVWNAGSVYTGGETVSHGGRTWRAKWWVTGEEPGATGEWGVWEDLGAC